MAHFQCLHSRYPPFAVRYPIKRSWFPLLHTALSHFGLLTPRQHFRLTTQARMQGRRRAKGPLEPPKRRSLKLKRTADLDSGPAFLPLSTVLHTASICAGHVFDMYLTVCICSPVRYSSTGINSYSLRWRTRGKNRKDTGKWRVYCALPTYLKVESVHTIP